MVFKFSYGSKEDASYAAIFFRIEFKQKSLFRQILFCKICWSVGQAIQHFYRVPVNTVYLFHEKLKVNFPDNCLEEP